MITRYVALLLCFFSTAQAMERVQQKTYYEVLDLTSNATTEQIKASYRRLALIWHPDRNPAKKEEATAKFQELAQAYQILSDENARKKYDQSQNKDAQTLDEKSTVIPPFSFADALGVFEAFARSYNQNASLKENALNFLLQIAESLVNPLAEQGGRQKPLPQFTVTPNSQQYTRNARKMNLKDE